jgi:hypothetical protein
VCKKSQMDRLMNLVRPPLLPFFGLKLLVLPGTDLAYAWLRHRDAEKTFENDFTPGRYRERAADVVVTTSLGLEPC